jgi:O-antigen ligase
LFGCGLVVLVLTYSRGAWIAVFSGVVYVTWKKKRVLCAPLAAVAVLGALAVPAISTRLSNATTKTTIYAAGTPANSLAWRFSHWRETSRYFTDRPLTGVGLENVKRFDREGLEPHNVIVQTGAELGVVGLAALLVLMGAMYKTSRRFRALPHNARSVAVIAMAATLGLALQAMVTNVLTQPVLLWYWAALAAPAFAAVTLSRSRTAAGETRA